MTLTRLQGRSWFVDDLVLIERVSAGVGVNDIAHELDRTPDAVTNRKHLLGVRSPVVPTCWCGNPLPTYDGNGRPHSVYCSANCRGDKVKAEHLERLAQINADRSCPVCGKAFELDRRSDAKYCSLTCNKRAWYLKAKAKPGYMQERVKRTQRWRQAHA